MRAPQLLRSRATEPLGAGMPVAEQTERRRPSRSSFTLKPDPRRLRDALGDLDARLVGGDARQRRVIRVLVAELVARLLTTSPRTAIEIAVEEKANSIRLDVWQPPGAPCEFFEGLDEAAFVDLASAWGPDRRRECGAWFEVL